MSDVASEINEMLTSLAEPTGKDQEPEPEPTPAPEPEPKVEPEPEPEPKKEETVEPEAEEHKAEPEPTPTPEPKKEPVVDDRDKTISDLRSKIAELESRKVEPKELPKEDALTFESQEFTKDLDMDELSRDPEELNKVMNKIYQKAVADAHKIVSEKFSKALPDIVTRQIETLEGLRTMRDNFFKENEDLKPFGKVVATIFDEIAAKDPKRNYSDVMKEVASETRKRLDLPLKQAAKSSEAVKSEPPPSLPKRGSKAGRSSDKQTVDPLQAELEEMNKILGR